MEKKMETIIVTPYVEVFLNIAQFASEQHAFGAFTASFCFMSTTGDLQSQSVIILGSCVWSSRCNK